MASRDLVGRPLVPFFDSDDNVNDSLQLAAGDNEHEAMDVDARVWDKELGYFVYPSEQVSKPVTIAATNRESRTDSGSKLLLTPSMMLSSSAPENVNSIAANGNPVQTVTDDTPRSSSVKRGSKQKSRPNTPARRKDKEGSDDTSAVKGSSTSKKGKNKGNNTNSNGAQSSSNQQTRNGKQKEQLSASGKWAWSAFQSSPDPAELPMPPFLTKPVGGLSNGNSVSTPPAPPLPPTSPPALHVAPPLPPGAPPSQPPLPPMPAPPEVTTATPMSIEVSMTQDLRRMLNIGGG